MESLLCNIYVARSWRQNKSPWRVELPISKCSVEPNWMYFLWGWSGQSTVWSTQRWTLTIFKTSRLSCRINSSRSPREKSNNSSDGVDLPRYPHACQETHLLKCNPSGRAMMALLCVELGLTSPAPRSNLVMVDEASCQELSSVMIITAGGSRRRFRWIKKNKDSWEMVQA